MENQSKNTTSVEVVSTNKGHVTEHKALLSGQLEGVTVVKLDMNELGETRWRLRTPNGSESRVTECKHSHTQETRNRKEPALYALDEGWLACASKVNGHLLVDMAFANSDKLFLEIPKNVDCVIRLSGPAVFTFFSNVKTPAPIKKDELYEEVKNLEEKALFELYAESAGLSVETVESMVKNSFKSKAV